MLYFGSTTRRHKPYHIFSIWYVSRIYLLNLCCVDRMIVEVCVCVFVCVSLSLSLSFLNAKHGDDGHIPLLLCYQYIDLYVYVCKYVYEIIAHMQVQRISNWRILTHRIVSAAVAVVGVDSVVVSRFFSSFRVFLIYAAPFQLYQIQPFHQTLSWLLFIETTINQSTRVFRTFSTSIDCFSVVYLRKSAVLLIELNLNFRVSF